MSEWCQKRLDTLVDFLPKRPLKKGQVAPFVAMADITENQKYILHLGTREYKGGGSRFSNGDTLFARITPCLENGKTVLVEGLDENKHAHGSTEFIVMSPRNLENDKQFLYYLARLPEFRKFAESRMEGTSGRQRVSWQALAEYQLNCPPAYLRKNIGDILGSLDDKIELNHQMNQTLEAMAQALFKSWFVDFDPVIDNALKAGNPIPEPLQKKAQKRLALGDRRQPLPDSLQGLFSNAFVHTEEMGWIPEGWEINALGTVASELRRGISPKYLDADGVRVVNQKCIRNHAINFELTRRHNPKARKIDGRELSIGDVLINSTGVGTLGRMAQVLHLTEVTIVDSHVTVVRSNPDFFYPFVFGQTLLSMEPKVESMGEGSTGQTELSRANLKELYVLAPPLPLQEIMEKKLIALVNRQVKATDSSYYLGKIRDTLLPKLISGKLRVSNENDSKNKAAT